LKNTTLAEKFTPAILSIITIIVYIDTHSLIPFISKYATQLGADVFLAGVIIAAYSLFEDAFEITFGYLMDIKGKRKAFVLRGMLGDGVSLILYYLSRNPIHLLFTRVVHGFTGSFAGPGIMSLTADCPHPLTKLGARMGLYGTSIIAATIIGYVLGGMISKFIGVQLLFLTVAVLLFIGASIGLIMKEPPPFLDFEETRRKVSIRLLLSDLLSLLRRKGYLAGCLGVFAHMVTMGAMTTLLPHYFEEIGFGVEIVGLILATYAFAALIFQVPIGYLLDKYGRFVMLTIGFIVTSLSMFFVSYANYLPILFLIFFIYGIGYSFLFPTLATLIIENSRPTERSLASGFFHVVFTQGVVLGAPLLGFVSLKYGTALGLRASCIAPLIALFITIILLRVKK